MTFKDLQRLIGSQSESDVNHSSSPKQLLLARLRDKPFWLWESIVHKEKYRIRGRNCCFNHIIGLPTKDGIKKPIFDYEKMLLEPGYLNSTSITDSDDPTSLNVCQSIPSACPQKYKSLVKYSCHERARNTNTLREIWVLILLSS